ncbi:MAG: S8 family serine peptidase [Caldilineaceae bacterium]|nr:S8 family serine peptidase [Caldilineaceae bacterium]
MVPLLAMAVATLLMWSAIPGEASLRHERAQAQTIKIEGMINELPTDGIYGLWVVAGHLIFVPEEAQIHEQAGKVAIGAAVVVHGQLQPDGLIHASRIRVTKEKRQDADAGKLLALVLDSPESANGQGEWRVRSHRDRVWWLTVDGQTQIIGPLPQKGQWVEVEGISLQGNKVLARTLRVDDYVANEVIVRIKEGVTIETVAQRHNLSVIHRLLQSTQIYLLSSSHEDDETLFAQLKHDDDILWAELNYIGSVPMADPYQIWKWGGTDPQEYENQIAFDQIALRPVQPFYKGDGVIVAILDTGISLTHPLFRGRLGLGYDWVDDDDDASEEGDGLAWGHGTHVAGIIAQIAPNSTILPVRVLDANGRGDIFIVAYAIEWAVAQGADVINLSLGTEYDSEVLRKTIRDAAAAGVIIVAAAGNAGGYTIQYPAAYRETLAVTAVDEMNHKADFANYNDWVDIAAPGVGITSAITGPEGDGYASWSGTSMATPFVSGVAALSRAKDRDASTVAIHQRLIENAVDINFLNPDFQGRVGSLLNATDVLGAPIQIYVPVVKR